jgi:hypothetical protein
MILDNDILASLGINLNDNKATALMEHFESTLKERIGTEIFESLDDDQAAELISLQQKHDNEAVAAFIKKNVPDFKEIVEDETDILLGELADNAASYAA